MDPTLLYAAVLVGTDPTAREAGWAFVAQVVEYLCPQNPFVTAEAVVSRVFDTLTTQLQTHADYHHLLLGSPDFQRVLREFVRFAQLDLLKKPKSAAHGTGTAELEAEVVHPTEQEYERLTIEKQTVTRERLDREVWPHCTEREREVLEACLAAGWETATAAGRLSIKVSAVHKVLSRVRQKIVVAWLQRSAADRGRLAQEVYPRCTSHERKVLDACLDSNGNIETAAEQLGLTDKEVRECMLELQARCDGGDHEVS